MFVAWARLRDQSVIWFHGFETLKISYNPTKFGGYRHCGSGDKHGFNLPRDLARPRDKMVTWLHEKEPNKASYDHAKFSGYSYSGSGAIIDLAR